MTNTLQQLVAEYVGQPVAVLCARYNYRGILSAVVENGLVLAQARAVETSGPSSGDRPQVEDTIGSSVIIPLHAVELIYQPNWVHADLAA